ncbi:hypothetical protein [Photorhabdus asymbiotica]
MSNPLVRDYFLTCVPATASMMVQAGKAMPHRNGYSPVLRTLFESPPPKR